jgi:predicted  nucleic acid-binding Zn-ribbon protein
MAFARKNLKAMGLEDDTVDAIIDMHREVVDGIKEKADKYKAAADKLAEAEKTIEDLKKQVEGVDSYKEKYEKEHKDFEAYKKNIDAEKTKAKKSEAYKAVLKEAGVSEKRYDAILRLTDLDKVELDDEGKIKDSAKVVEDVKKEWSDYIVKTEEHGAGTETPPAGAGAGDRTLSRAAQVAQKHNERLYGIKSKGESDK